MTPWACSRSPIERGMEALLSSVLIAGMANGSEGLDYGTLPCKVLEDPGAVLRALVVIPRE